MPVLEIAVFLTILNDRFRLLGCKVETGFDLFGRRFIGSARESVKTVILRGFPNNEKFGLERGHALSLEKEIAKILVSAASA